MPPLFSYPPQQSDKINMSSTEQVIKTTRRPHNYSGVQASSDEITAYVTRAEREKRAAEDRKAFEAAILAFAENAETRPALMSIAEKLHATAYVEAAVSGEWNLCEVAKIIYASPYVWDRSMTAAEQDIGNTYYWADFTSRPYSEAVALLALLPKSLRQ